MCHKLAANAEDSAVGYGLPARAVRSEWLQCLLHLKAHEMSAAVLTLAAA